MYQRFERQWDHGRLVDETPAVVTNAHGMEEPCEPVQFRPHLSGPALRGPRLTFVHQVGDPFHCLRGLMDARAPTAVRLLEVLQNVYPHRPADPGDDVVGVLASGARGLSLLAVELLLLTCALIGMIGPILRSRRPLARPCLLRFGQVPG